MQALSNRLREFLVGDIVRGVNVGLDRPADEGAMSKAGALETVTISWLAPHEPEADPSLARPDQSSDGQAAETPRLGTSTRLRLLPVRTKGIQISMQYEHAECEALLLPSSEDVAHPLEDVMAAVERVPLASDPLINFAPGKLLKNDPNFLHLPLLLMRMPAHLKASVFSFLSHTFDCRVSSLNLGTRSLVRALEKWTGGMSAETHLDAVKDVVLTLGFYYPTVMRCQQQRQPHKEQHQPRDMGQNTQMDYREEDDAAGASESALGVKSIDIIIPGANLVRFVTAGKAHEVAKDASAGQTRGRRKRAGAQDRDTHAEAKRRRLGGDKDEEGWTWRQRPDTSENPGSSRQPFTDALAQYVLQHLALDMFHPAVRISKVACGGFVLSEGRVKFFGLPPGAGADHGIPDAKQRAAWGVLDVLLEKSRVETPGETLRGEM